MSDDPAVTPSARLAALPDKPRPPASVSILNQWVNQADSKTNAGGRLAWLVASTVVVAALQRAVDYTQTPYFLLKGGTLLQHRLGQETRATKDIDGLIRGDVEEFLAGVASSELVGWANMFVVYYGNFDFSPNRVYVWGGKPTGAVWFDTEDQVPRDVRMKANLRYNQEKLGRLGVPIPVPISVPVPVPVPV